MLLEQLKEEIDEESLLLKLGARKLSGDGNPRFKMICLNPEHKDRHPSFMYRTDRHTYICYSCGCQGDVIDLVQMVNKIDFRQAVQYLKDFANFKSEFDDEALNAILEKRRTLKEVNDDRVAIIDYPAYFSNDFSSASDLTQAYIKKRRWPISLLSDYDIGYCERGYFRDRIIFTIRSSGGALVSFAARDTTNNASDKYLYPLDCPIAKIIWGIDMRLDSTPIFLEGIPDALRLRQFGYNAFAVLGNQLGNFKIKMIRKLFANHKKIIVIPDNDNGGSTMLQWFQNLIHDFEIEVGLVKRVKDVDELDKLGIEKVLSETVKLPEYMVDFHLKEPELPSIVTRVQR